MNYHVAQQQADNWCWAASIQMALSTKNIQVDQAELVRRTFGAAVDRPGSVLDTLRHLNGPAIRRDGQRVQLSSQFREGFPTFQTLKHQLERNTPILISQENPGLSIGHALVVTAMIYESTSNGPRILRLICRDPSPHLAVSGGKRILTPDEFHRVIGHFVIEID